MPSPKRRKFQIRQRQKRRKKREIVAHALRSRGSDAFEILRKCCSSGFIGRISPNVSPKASETSRYSAVAKVLTWGEPSRLRDTYGDVYVLEMKTRAENAALWKHSKNKFVKKAYPDQVKVIHIFLNPELTQSEIRSRKLFYEKELAGNKIEFIDILKLKKFKPFLIMDLVNKGIIKDISKIYPKKVA